MYEVPQSGVAFNIDPSPWKDFTQNQNIAFGYKVIQKNFASNELFISQAGARENANKVLVVITDGESTDQYNLEDAIQNAERKKITRYAIGVGNVFNKPSAAQELNDIASKPNNKYVFKVNDFSVLKEIQETLEANIIAIEGTQTSGDSTKLEFAQDGFNADFDSKGNIIMSAVGAFQWKGGHQTYDKLGTPLNSFQKGNSNDSYLGYSLAIAKTYNKQYYIIQGAPRDNHIGAVIITDNQDNVLHTLNSPEPQIGAYYGAEVCVVDLDLNNSTDLLLVSAPLHNEKDQEGKVFIYTFLKSSVSQVSQVKYIQAVTGIPAQRGRFGLTLASPADLNRDGLVDVVIGAPFEENGQGSIYIFNGRKEDIASTFSQRIRGSSVRSGLQFFGYSLSQSALDHSGDQLPDLAVGSKGAVTLLRSRPIVDLKTTACPNDALNPISNELVFTFEGLPSKLLNNLRPMLPPTIKNTSDHNVENDLRDLSVNVSITVPIKLGVKDIWTNNNMQIEGCSVEKDEPPQIPNFAAALEKQAEVTGLRSAVFELVSTATLDYNKTTYIYFSTGSVNTAPMGKINTQVELYDEKFPLKETIGGVVGGLVFLALITAILYKTGFFKSNYKNLMDEAAAEAETEAEPKADEMEKSAE
ncbi:Integrin alpha-X [Bagarius yarrelli]|uniref:Integrin alpha-X n=1 Tax=Bagarius yarrelli TaxID=175774 RepID=A0A556TIE6_BAGYA|nr:Integrin alpha-X [Bagarius yarrelli]